MQWHRVICGLDFFARTIHSNIINANMLSWVILNYAKKSKKHYWWSVFIETKSLHILQFPSSVFTIEYSVLNVDVYMYCVYMFSESFRYTGLYSGKYIAFVWIDCFEARMRCSVLKVCSIIIVRSIAYINLCSGRIDENSSCVHNYIGCRIRCILNNINK